MGYSPLFVNFILLIVAMMLLFYFSSTFRYYFKICFLNIWMVLMPFNVSPILILRGRNVANMRVLRLFMLPVKYVLGLKINVQGAERLNLNGPYVLVANYRHSVDFLGLSQILPERCTLIFKKKICYFFTVGIGGWLSNFIFIDHEKKAAEDVISEVAASMIQKQLRVWVFSDDSRNSNSLVVLPFRHGAFHLAVQAQVPLIPVVMSSYQTFLKKKVKRFSSGEVTVQILPPLKTKGLSQADVPEFADRVQKAMLSASNEISASGGKSESAAK